LSVRVVARNQIRQLARRQTSRRHILPKRKRSGIPVAAKSETINFPVTTPRKRNSLRSGRRQRLIGRSILAYQIKKSETDFRCPAVRENRCAGRRFSNGKQICRSQTARTANIAFRFSASPKKICRPIIEMRNLRTERIPTVLPVCFLFTADRERFDFLMDQSEEQKPSSTSSKRVPQRAVPCVRATP